jgi:DNA-directed RNA polymerase sigma subunit (sigma70/sigma32)
MSRPDVLARLAPRERELLDLRYDAEGNEIRTLEEVSLAFDVTRERVRHLEWWTARKLLQAYDAEGGAG